MSDLNDSAGDSSGTKIFRELVGFMVTLGMGTPDVAPSTLLVDELELDSLDWVDLAKELEEHFGIALRDRPLATLETVGDVAELIRTRVGGSGADPA